MVYVVNRVSFNRQKKRGGAAAVGLVCVCVLDTQMVGWVDGRINGRIDGWMDE